MRHSSLQDELSNVQQTIVGLESEVNNVEAGIKEKDENSGS